MGNQILFWSRYRNIGYLSINCFCWSTLNSILRTPIRNIINEIFGPEVSYHAQNAIKCFILRGQYIKDNVYWADLFTRVKLRIKEIRMDMIYLPMFNFWGYIFQSTNTLLLIDYIDFKLMKDQTFLVKVLKLMIHTRSSRILQNYSPS